MAANKILELIVSYYLLISTIIFVVYPIMKTMQYMLNYHHISLYKQLKHTYYYQYIIFYDITSLLMQTIKHIFRLSIYISIIAMVIHYSDQIIHINDFNTNKNHQISYNIKLGTVFLFTPYVIKYIWYSLIHLIVLILITNQWIQQKQILLNQQQANSKIKMYKQIYDLQYNIIIKDINNRSKLIDEINVTIDQLIKENKTICLKNETIKNLTLISFRVGNHKLLNTLEIASVHNMYNPEISYAFLKNAIRHKKNKKLHYTPIQMVY